ncbi:MAG: hypothetical protein ABI980_10805 [Nitrospirota bacterium]
MVKITIDLAEITGSWRITRIVVNKDGTGHPIKIERDTFKYRSEAVRDAKMRALWFLKQNYGAVAEGEIVWQIWPPVPSEGNPLV